MYLVFSILKLYFNFIHSTIDCVLKVPVSDLKQLTFESLYLNKVLGFLFIFGDHMLMG